MCTNPVTIKLLRPRIWEAFNGIQSPSEMKVPCGKCAECMKHRQNNIVSRVIRYLDVQPLACFMTLTYRNDSVPVSRSLWRMLPSGETEMVFPPELCPDKLRGDETRFNHLAAYARENLYPCKGAPVFDIPCTGLNEYAEDGSYWMACTPTLYQRDVTLAMKRFRKNFKGRLPDFKYICVGEYGSNPNYTQRPHYHLIVFGLDYFQLLRFRFCWPYGNVNVKQISFGDGKKSQYKVAKYVGKYAAKGIFDTIPNIDGLTLRSRMCSSVGVGLELNQMQKDWYLAKDICQYDEDNPQATLPFDKKYEVINRILDRLKIYAGTTKSGDRIYYPLPRGLVEKIMGVRYVSRFSDLPEGLKRPGGFHNFALSDKERIHLRFDNPVKVFSPIWYMVTDYIRDKQDTLYNDMLSLWTSRFEQEGKNPAFAVFAFEDSLQSDLQHKEEVAKSRLLNSLRNEKILD